MKYRLTDGTEVPARLVLKDEDLDLAFLAPLKPLDKATEAKTAVRPVERMRRPSPKCSIPRSSLAGRART